jgi:biopolymer transport protein ExbB/TolQ
LYSVRNLVKMLMARGFSKPQKLGRKEFVSGSHLSARGGSMRNYLIVMVATICLGICLATQVRAQNVDWHAQQKMLKSQQKLAWHALQVQQQNRKLSWKGQKTSGLDRDRANHEMQRERRDLKQKQKDARQDLKDRQRSTRDMQHAYSH